MMHACTNLTLYNNHSRIAIKLQLSYHIHYKICFALHKSRRTEGITKLNNLPSMCVTLLCYFYTSLFESVHKLKLIILIISIHSLQPQFPICEPEDAISIACRDLSYTIEYRPTISKRKVSLLDYLRNY